MSDPPSLLRSYGAMMTAVILLVALASCASVCPFYPILSRTYVLQYAPADRVAETLTREEKGVRESFVEVVADARTNSVVVKGTDEELARLEKWIRELDIR